MNSRLKWKIVRNSLVALVSAWVINGCSSGPVPDASTNTSTDAIVCGSHIVLDRDGAPVEVPSWYNARGINAKLKYYPDLAARLGRDHIATCADGHDYDIAYEQYATEHPGFDDDQPIQFEKHPPLPEKMPAASSDEKIASGDINSFAPVVQLQTTYRGKIHFCTGTFIAKNWIATAAHCLNIGPGPGVQADNAYYPFTVVWSDALGHVGRQVTIPYVLQYLSPNYRGDFGEDLTPKPRGEDFALLNVPEYYNSSLPLGTPNGGDFMLLSMVDSAPPSSSEAWGWGEPALNLLESMPLDNYVPIFVDSGDNSALLGQIPSNPPLLCLGDSGGPLVDKFQINDPTTGDPTEAPAVVATLVGGKVANQMTSQCLDAAGGPVVWSRMSQHYPFISQSMQDIYGPNFQCKQVRLTGSGATLAQCWLTPCQADDDCKDDPNTHCKNPGSADLFTCSPSRCAGTDMPVCGCIYGQCEPKLADDTDAGQ
jgi:hypothetical protein